MLKSHEKVLTEEQKALVTKNLPLAKHMAKKYYRGPCLAELHEYFCAASDGLFRAAQKYDPSFGRPFGSYAAQWMAAFLNAHRLSKLKKSEVWGTNFSDALREDRSMPVDAGCYRLRSPASQAATNDLLDRCRELLDDRQWDIMVMHYRDLVSGPEIAEKYGITRERVRQIIQQSLQIIQRRIAVE